MKLHSLDNRRLVSRLAMGTAAVASVAGVAAATIPAAGAAVTSRSAVVAPAAPQGLTPGGPSTKAVHSNHQASVIVCHMVYQGANGGLPHHSGHYPGSVNVRVRVTCTRPVSGILGYVALFQISKKGKILRRTPARKYSSTGRGAANGNAALGCKPGYYEGDSAARVTFPAGYTPHTALLQDHTKVAHLRKC